MSDPCRYEKEIGALIQHAETVNGFIREIRNNHLKSIYEKLDVLAKGRPTWPVALILSGLSTLCGILITVLLRGGG